ncbi:hypothetical protein EF907_05685 [Streptomyces sp. WAC06273]|nr:hypothetical protein EF907_05685 [Streptomyces sp. WAC06273]
MNDQRHADDQQAPGGAECGEETVGQRRDHRNDERQEQAGRQRQHPQPRRRLPLLRLQGALPLGEERGHRRVVGVVEAVPQADGADRLQGPWVVGQRRSVHRKQVHGLPPCAVQSFISPSEDHGTGRVGPRE